MRLRAQSALLIVDVQKDFCEGGALPVPRASVIIPILDRLIQCFTSGPIYASRDWHPPNSFHFSNYGGKWPTHCVAHTQGAAFHDGLRLPADVIIVSKGQTRTADGYSVFDGQTSARETFAQVLATHSVKHLFVGGLATDYCVRHSVLDARRAGFRVTVLSDAVAGVEVRPRDSERALKEMLTAGAELSPSSGLQTEST